MKDVPITLNTIFSILYFVLLFISVIQSIKLALRNGSAIKFFCFLIPVLWFFSGIVKYYAYLSIYNEKPSIVFILINNLFNTFLWLGIYLFYCNKNNKSFFDSLP
jgi:hypothetical protein